MSLAESSALLDRAPERADSDRYGPHLAAMSAPPESPRRLDPFPEDWERALAVVAHPDDMEYGTSAAVARWTAQGKSVAYCLLTAGEAGIDTLDPEQAGPVRKEEQRAACAAVGVTELEFLGFPDGVLEYGIPLRRAIAAVIRRHRPEIVITGNFRDTFGPGAFNMADHIVAGQATLDAARDAGNRWVFRDLLGKGLEPWNGVRLVAAGGSPQATHGVDIGEHFDAGVESLMAHRAYFESFGANAPDPEEMLEGFARLAGAQLGVRLATSFEVYPLQFL